MRAAVHSLLDQDYDGPFEVTLALGPSIDGTTELVEEMAAVDPRIRVVANEVGSTPAGLNIAIRASSYPVVIRVDAHSVLPRDYARIAVETLQRTGADNVGGIMDAQGDQPVPAGRRPRLRHPRRPGRHRRSTSAARRARPRPCTSAASAATASSRSGMFDEGIKRGQDWELNRRLREARRHRSGSPPRSRSSTGRGPSLSRLARQMLSTGLWRGELARRFPAIERPALLRPAGHGARRHRRPAAGHRRPRAGCCSARRRGCCSDSLAPAGLPRSSSIAATIAGHAARRVSCRALVSRSLAVHSLLLGYRVRARLPQAHQQHHGTHGKITMTSGSPGTARPSSIAELRAVAQPPEVRMRAQRRALDGLALPARPLAVPHLDAAEDAHLGERRHRADDPRRLVHGRRPAHPRHLGRAARAGARPAADARRLLRRRGRPLAPDVVAGRGVPRQGRALHDRGADPDRPGHPRRRLPVRGAGRLPLDDPRPGCSRC